MQSQRGMIRCHSIMRMSGTYVPVEGMAAVGVLALLIGLGCGTCGKADPDDDEYVRRSAAVSALRDARAVRDRALKQAKQAKKELQNAKDRALSKAVR